MIQSPYPTAHVDRCGTVAFNDYAGYRTVHVRIVGETPQRFRCRFFSGRHAGATRLVPKRAVVAQLLPGECLEHDAGKASK